MTAFKFPFGAAVILITSAPVLAQQLADQAVEERNANERERDGKHPVLGAALRSYDEIEAGIVIGRASFITGENQYQVRYRDGSGCQVERWFGQSAIGFDPRASNYADADLVFNDTEVKATDPDADPKFAAQSRDSDVRVIAEASPAPAFPTPDGRRVEVRYWNGGRDTTIEIPIL